MNNQFKKIRPSILFVILAGSLLLLAGFLQVPMMMYDHFDLIPLLREFESGNLSLKQLIGWHGGHSHSTAYLVLLFTTTLSNGQILADIFASWLFLVFYALLMCWCVRKVFGDLPSSRLTPLLCLTIAMTLTTLHLPNLIWGWQVAIFINLIGLALGVCAVCINLTLLMRLLMGVVGIVLAISSFATGAVLLPAMLIGLWMQGSIPVFTRLALSVLWGGFLIFLLDQLHYFSAGVSEGNIHFIGIVHYAINYLGGGAVRFATILSIPVFICSAVLFPRVLARLMKVNGVAASMWTTIGAFACGAALLTAFGRYDAFGTSQAWVIRYGTFAALYWFALLGALFTLREYETESRILKLARRTLMVLFAINSLHFVPQANDFSVDAKALQASVISDWPNVSTEVLGSLHPSDPEIAQSGLRYLKEKSYPPFRDEKQ